MGANFDAKLHDDPEYKDLEPDYWHEPLLDNATRLGDCFSLPQGSVSLPPQTEARLPLAMVAEGERVLAIAIAGGRRMQRRLADIGIVRGAQIAVVSRSGNGSMIVALSGCRLGLGAGMAHRVIVTPVK